MAAPKKYPDELRERAVKMVFEIRERDGKGHGDDHNPRLRPRTQGCRQIGGHLPTRERYLGHASPQSPGPDGSEHMPKGALIAGTGTHRTPGLTSRVAASGVFVP
jgi:hypothetical protein